MDRGLIETPAMSPAKPPPSLPTVLRSFRPQDAAAVDRLALAGYAEFAPHYSDWPAMAANIGRMSGLAAQGELIVAVRGRALVGAVAYVGPGRTKPAFFDPQWPVIRMLVVDPAMRGGGIGRLLTEACISRARRDGAAVIALHTSPIMAVALPLYLRMGFERVREAPPLHGVSYAVYLKRLD